VYRIYFARCINIFNSLLAPLVKYDVHTTRKIKIDTRYFLSHIIIIYPSSQQWLASLYRQSKTRTFSQQLHHHAAMKPSMNCYLSVQLPIGTYLYLLVAFSRWNW